MQVSCPKTQEANMPAYLHTNPFKCWTSSREAVNTKFLKSWGWLGQGIEPWPPNYESLEIEDCLSQNGLFVYIVFDLRNIVTATVLLLEVPSHI